jgi:ribosomal protein L12E/L44/L45/RPP1/RPP2
MEQAQQTEAEALRDRLWTFAQWGVIGLVVFMAGLFLGYQLWGQATKLQAQVEDLTDKVQSVVKERDTERSRITLIERDKKELERQLEELRAKVAAAPAAPAAAPQ